MAQGKEGVGSILDLFWEISAKFFIKKLFKQIRFETTIKLKSEKEKILQWVRTQVGDTITIKNISSLQDARILCHLIHKYQPSSMDNNYLGRSATENYEKSLEILYNHWNIVYLLPLDEFVNSTLPERSLLLFYTFMIQKIQEDFSFLTPDTAAIVTFINKEIEGIIHDDSPLPASSPRKTPRNKDKKTPRSKDSSKDASKIHEEPATPLSPRSASRKKDAASMDASKVYEEPGTPLSPRSASRKKDAASKDASKIHEESGTPLSPRSGSRKRGATSNDASKMHEESATPLSPRSGSRKKDATSKDSSKDQAKENNKESSKESVKITVKDSPSRENLLETEKRRKRNHSENSTSSRSEKKRPKSRKIASGMVTGSQEDPLGPSGLGYSNSTSSSAPGGLPKSKTRKKSRNSVARKEEKSKLIEELSEINKQIQMKAEKYEEESKLFSLKLQSAKSKKKMLSEENRRLLDENERLKEEVKKFKEEVNTLNREKLTSLLKKPPSKPLLRKTSGLSESSESSDFEKSKKVLRTSGKIPFLQNRSNSSSKHIFSPPASVNRVLSDENISLVEPDSENSTSEIFPSPRPLLRTSFAFPSPPVNHPPPPPPPPPSSSSTSTSPKQNGAGTDSETSGPLSQRERKALLKVKLGDGTFISVIIKPTTSANELKSEIIKKLVKRLAGDNREDAEKSFKSTHQLMEEVLISDQQILFDSLDHYTSESKVLLFKDPKASQNNFYASLTNQSSNDSSSEPKISIESAHFNRSTDQVVSILANKIQILSQENEGLRSKNLQLKMKKKGKNDKLLMIDTSKLEVNEKIADTGGSFAKVYNVSVDGWGCAMKELEIEEFRNQFSDQPEGSGFIREVELLQNLPTHPNIVKYLFCDRNSPSRTRLFMQKYAGTLRNFLNMKRQRNNGFFEPEDIQRYLLDICAGINYLHQHTIIHRGFFPFFHL